MDVPSFGLLDEFASDEEFNGVGRPQAQNSSSNLHHEKHYGFASVQIAPNGSVASGVADNVRPSRNPPRRPSVSGMFNVPPSRVNFATNRMSITLPRLSRRRADNSPSS